MKAYRYEARNRADRKFNTCGREKNPNAVKFFASNLEYAQNYRFATCAETGERYECQLIEAEIAVNLFDMQSGFRTLKAFAAFKAEQERISVENAKMLIKWEKKASERKKLQNIIENGVDLKVDAIVACNEFQDLSDFEFQNILVAELKEMGFDGYYTKNEIAIF